MDNREVAESIDDFLTDTLEVIRMPILATPYTTTGQLRRGTPSTFTIHACVQPADNQELRLPTGNYATDGIIVYSRTVLNISSTDGRYEADRIRFGGRVYEVSQTNNWAFEGAYNRAVAILEEARDQS